MKILLLVPFMLSSTYTLANEPVYKSWKTFISDQGFELKYPECWEIKSNDAYIEGSPETLQDIFVTESARCSRSRLRKYLPNGLSIFSGEKNNSAESTAEIITKNEKLSKSWIESKKWLLFKKIKIEGSLGSYYYVENFQDRKEGYVIWRYEILCPTRTISIRGPSIDSPPKEMLEALKQGDYIPEPYNTIFRSLKCADSKIKR